MGGVRGEQMRQEREEMGGNRLDFGLTGQTPTHVQYLFFLYIFHGDIKTGVLPSVFFGFCTYYKGAITLLFYCSIPTVSIHYMFTNPFTTISLF